MIVSHPFAICRLNKSGHVASNANSSEAASVAIGMAMSKAKNQTECDALTHKLKPALHPSQQRWRA